MFSGFAHGSQGQGLSAIDPDTGRVAWHASTAAVAFTPKAIVTNFDPAWAAIDPVTGESRWFFLDGSPYSSSGVTVGDLFIRSHVDTVELRRLSDGTIIDTFVPAVGAPVSTATPSGGQLFVTTSTTLYAIKPID